MDLGQCALVCEIKVKNRRRNGAEGENGKRDRTGGHLRGG